MSAFKQQVTEALIKQAGPVSDFQVFARAIAPRVAAAIEIAYQQAPGDTYSKTQDRTPVMDAALRALRGGGDGA